MDTLLYLGRIETGPAIVWMVATVAAWIVLIRAFCLSASTWKRLGIYCIVLSVVGSTLVLAWTVLLFTVRQGHPLKQYNAADWDAWDMWVATWPWMFFGIPIIGVGMFALAPFVMRVWPPGVKLAWGFSLALSGITEVAVFLNIPMA